MPRKKRRARARVTQGSIRAPARPRRYNRAAASIARQIRFLRGERVILDRDLAQLYGVTTGALNQAVKRNIERFPIDFMLEASNDETAILISQSVIPSGAHGGRRGAPRFFTEQGVAMLSSVLRSRRAIRVNIEIMRAFVRLRELLAAHADLSRKLTEMERRYDGQFKAVFDAIRQLMTPPPDPPRRLIGFRVTEPRPAALPALGRTHRRKAGGRE